MNWIHHGLELGQEDDSVFYHTLKCVSDVSHEYTMNTNMYSVYRLLLRLNVSEYNINNICPFFEIIQINV